MGHAGGQVAHGGELFAAAHLGFQPAHLAQVAQHDKRPHRRALLGAHGRNRYAKGNHGTAGQGHVHLPLVRDRPAQLLPGQDRGGLATDQSPRGDASQLFGRAVGHGHLVVRANKDKPRRHGRHHFRGQSRGLAQGLALGPVALGPEKPKHAAQAHDEDDRSRGQHIVQVGPPGGLDGGYVQGDENDQRHAAQGPPHALGVAVLGAQKFPLASRRMGAQPMGTATGRRGHEAPVDQKRLPPGFFFYGQPPLFGGVRSQLGHDRGVKKRLPDARGVAVGQDTPVLVGDGDGEDAGLVGGFLDKMLQPDVRAEAAAHPGARPGLEGLDQRRAFFQ